MNQRVVVPVVYVTAVFMNIMDVTIVNVALPSVGREFHTPASALNAVSVSYLLSLTVVIPAAGWMGQRFGMKRTFLAAIVVFSLASAACGVAPSLPVLVAARALQGAGGGAMIPIGMALLMLTFSPHERVRVSSLLVIPTGLGPAVGPLLGGVLTTELSWRWVFYVNVPVGAAAVAFGWLFLDERPERSGETFDLRGFLLAGLGFGALMYGVSSGASHGWESGSVALALGAGAAAIVVLVRVETRIGHPILALRLYRNRLFRATSLSFLLGISALFGLLFMVPLFLQIGLGHSALRTGLDVFPEAPGVMLGGQLSSRWLYPYTGPRRLAAASLVGVAASAAAMTSVGAGTEPWAIRILMFLLGLAMGPVYLVGQATTFATIERGDMGQASSLFNCQRQFGAAAGVALLSTVLGLSTTPRSAVGADLAGYHHAFLAAAALALCGAAISLLIRDGDAAATVVRPTTRREPARPRTA